VLCLASWVLPCAGIVLGYFGWAAFKLEKNEKVRHGGCGSWNIINLIIKFIFKRKLGHLIDCVFWTIFLVVAKDFADKE